MKQFFAPHIKYVTAVLLMALCIPLVAFALQSFTPTLVSAYHQAQAFVFAYAPTEAQARQFIAVNCPHGSLTYVLSIVLLGGLYPGIALLAVITARSMRRTDSLQRPQPRAYEAGWPTYRGLGYFVLAMTLAFTVAHELERPEQFDLFDVLFLYGGLLILQMVGFICAMGTIRQGYFSSAKLNLLVSARMYVIGSAWVFCFLSPSTLAFGMLLGLMFMTMRLERLGEPETYMPSKYATRPVY